MSTDPHHMGSHAGGPPRHSDVSFEPQDVSPGRIYVFLIVLGVAVILSYAVCVFVLRITTRVAVESDTPPAPVRVRMGKNFSIMPPEPPLQGVPGHRNDPQADL